MFTLAVIQLVLPLLFSVILSPPTRARPLNPRILSTEGPAIFISPNAQTLVAQCEPLHVAFWNVGPPKNLTLWIAVNNVKTPAAFWEWPDSGAAFDAKAVFTQDWDAVDAMGGSVMWGELHGYQGDVTYLLGDGLTVQPSDKTSCLGGPGSESFYGDPTHFEQGQTLQAIVTTTLLSTSSAIPSASDSVVPPVSSSTITRTVVMTSPVRPTSSARQAASAAPGQQQPNLGSAISSALSTKGNKTHPAVIAASVIISVVAVAAIAGTWFLLRRMRRNNADEAAATGVRRPEMSMIDSASDGGGGSGSLLDVAGDGRAGHVSMADLPTREVVQPYSYSSPGTPVDGGIGRAASSTSDLSDNAHPSLPAQFDLRNPFQEVDAGHLAGSRQQDDAEEEVEDKDGGGTRIPPAYMSSSGSRRDPARPGVPTHPAPTSIASGSVSGSSARGSGKI